jgi:hypothetical protein
MKPRMQADKSHAGPAQEERHRLATVHTRFTRAMHGLVLTPTGKPSGFLPSTRA